MTFSDLIKNLNLISIPAILSCLACLWIFLKVFAQRKTSLGTLLILVLAISDFIFGLNNILSYFFPDFFILEADDVYDFVYFFAMYFSVWWASAISFLVYKSLREKDFDFKCSFFKMLIPIFVLSCSIGTL